MVTQVRAPDPIQILRPNSPQPIPFFHVDMGLLENTSERANGDIAFSRYYRDVNDFSKSPHEFDMAALLAGFEEAHRFKTSLDLAEGLRIKPPQPQPRSFESWVGVLPAVVQSKALAPLASWPKPHLPIHPGWLHLLPNIERRTKYLRSKRSLQSDAS